MKKILKIVKGLMASIFVVGGIMLAVFLVPQSGVKAMTVATGSMNPAIPQGSLVITRRVPPNTLKSGEVVTFINPANTRQTITHRIVETKTLSGLPGFVTKGDANQSPDKEILGGNIVGKVIWHVPVLGRVVNWVRQPIGLILVILLPAAIIVWGEVRQLRRTLSSLTPHTSNSEPEPTQSGSVQAATSKMTPAAVKPTASRSAVQHSRRRSIDSIRTRHLILMLAGSLLVVGSTKAQLSSKATLSNNTISTAASGSTGNCSGENDSITITDTAPGSNNSASINNNCTSSTTNTNNVSVVNETNQTTTTGNASTSNNSAGAVAVSGPSEAASVADTGIVVSNY